MLSPEVQDRLDAAQLAAPNYRPRKSISRQLGEKTLIMLVGPAAIGKTYIMKQVTELDPSFSLVSDFTTRDPRLDDDPALFHFLPHDDESVTRLLDQIDNQEIIQYAVHPTQGRIYGTELEDYHSENNMLATLSGAVDQFQQLPFKNTYVIGLTAEAAIWAGWFNTRYKASNPDRQKRLEEAVLSLDWLLKNSRRSSVTFVKNTEGDPSAAAQQIINIIRMGEIDDGGAHSQALAMRIWALGALDRVLSERKTA